MSRRRSPLRAALAAAAAAALAACASDGPERLGLAAVSLEAYRGRASSDPAAALRPPPPLGFRVYAAPGGAARLEAPPLATGRSDGGSLIVPAGPVLVVVDVVPPERVGPFVLAPGDEARVRLMDFPAARPARRIWRIERRGEPVARAFPPPLAQVPSDAVPSGGESSPPAEPTLPSVVARGGDPVEDASPGVALAHLPPARRVLRRAFENFYGCDLQEEVRIEVPTPGGRVLRYRARRLRKHIDGRAHEIWRVVGSSDLRDVRLLRIQNRDRTDDTFAYIPQLLRVRRLSTAQRGDLAFGLDVTLEELEVFEVERFEIVGRASASVRGELVHVVTVQSLRESGFDRADYLVAQRDYAILEIRLYRPGALEAYKITHMPRAGMERQGGHVLPRHVVFEHLERGTRTELFFESRVVDPAIPDALFTKTALESRRNLAPAQDRAPR